MPGQASAQSLDAPGAKKLLFAHTLVGQTEGRAYALNYHPNGGLQIDVAYGEPMSGRWRDGPENSLCTRFARMGAAEQCYRFERVGRKMLVWQSLDGTDRGRGRLMPRRMQ